MCSRDKYTSCNARLNFELKSQEDSNLKVQKCQTGNPYSS